MTYDVFTVDLHNYTLSLTARGSEERRTTVRGLVARSLPRSLICGKSVVNIRDLHIILTCGL